MAIEGFCCALVKLFGPLHEYVEPPEEERFSVCPAHSGPLDAAAATGDAVTTTVTVVVAEQPAAFVTVTE